MRTRRQSSLPGASSEGNSPSNTSTDQDLSFSKAISATPRNGKPSLYVSILKNQALSLTPRASSRDLREKVLVLDLDHTLMCNFKDGEAPVPGLKCPMKIKGIKHMFTIVKRPGLEKFVYEVSKYYRLMIYTTSLEEYAIAVLRTLGILPLVEKILHRDNCVQPNEGVFIKNVKDIGEPLEKLVFIDDSLKQVNSNLLNALPIPAFHGDPKDTQLIKLIPFLVSLAQKSDVRPVFHQYQKLTKGDRYKSDKQPIKLEIKLKTSTFRATSCTPSAKQLYKTMIDTSPSADVDLSPDGDFDITRTMPIVKLFEPKLLGTPSVHEKISSFTEMFNQRVSERCSIMDHAEKEDDPENAVLDDEEDDLRDCTPRLMDNLSKKSPMHAYKRQNRKFSTMIA